MLKAASSIHHLAVGEHSHPRRPNEAGEWVLDCPSCEEFLTRTRDPLWGPATGPAPLTQDEKHQKRSDQDAANANILQGLARMPEMAAALTELLDRQVKVAGQEGVPLAQQVAQRRVARRSRG